MHLRTYLSRNGLTQSAFAKELGVKRQTVDRWLRGDRVPRPEMMRQIARVTDGKVGPEDLVNLGAA